MLCMFYMRDMTYHTCPCTCTCAHVAVLYAGALRWHVFHRRMLCHLPSRHESTDVRPVRFSSMAILKMSNWSACYIHSDLGPLGAKYVSLAKCQYSRCRYTRRIFVAVYREKFWARIQRRYKRYVGIPDVIISKVYCTI